MRSRSIAAGALSAVTILMVGGVCLAESPRGLLPGHASAPLRCGAEGAGRVRCSARVVVEPDGSVTKLTGPVGFGPADLQSAYKLPTTGGNGKTVATVVSYDYPDAESDLAAYRGQFGLPPCTSASGCFKKVAGDGSTNLPPADPDGCGGWNAAAALDLQVLSATCPDCKLLLVEVGNDDFPLAVQTAGTLGASAIANSYGSVESAGDAQYAAMYSQACKGTLVTVSAASGYGVTTPESYAGVVAVGSTVLTQDTSTARGWSEVASTYSGSGCSAYVSRPAWQPQSTTMCSNRMTVDVAAVGDPSSPVAVYCGGAWVMSGGAPDAIIAGAYTLLGVSPDPAVAWQNPTAFFDVTTGSNGTCPTGLWCEAGVGYDGPTGWGTPNGTALLTIDAGAPIACPPMSDGGTEGGVAVGSDGGADGGIPVESGAGAEAGRDASSDGSAGSSADSSAGASTDGGANQETPAHISSNLGCGCATPGGSTTGLDAMALVALTSVAMVLGRRRRGG
jgi:MYXO-CTERM domain-containing protein